MAVPNFKQFREFCYTILPNYVGIDRADQQVCDHIAYDIFKFIRGDINKQVAKPEENTQPPITHEDIIQSLDEAVPSLNTQTAFNDRVLSCKRCMLDCGNRGPVPPHGAWGSALMIIGEAPGMAEDMKGIPLVGASELAQTSARDNDCIQCVSLPKCFGWFMGESDKHTTRSCTGYLPYTGPITIKIPPIFKTSGNLLDDCLKKVGINRRAIMVTNAVMCRPSEANDPPTNMQVVNCAPYLLELISENKPEVILVMGNIALRLLKPNSQGILKEAGRHFQYQSSLVIPTYHPSYVLRQKEQTVLKTFCDHLTMAKDNLSATAKEAISLHTTKGANK